MLYRIAMWTLAGFVIAGCWAVYLFLRMPAPLTSSEPILWILARLTQPIVFVSSYFGVGLRFYWVILANAAAYALFGLAVETVCQKVNTAKRATI